MTNELRQIINQLFQYLILNYASLIIMNCNSTIIKRRTYNQCVKNTVIRPLSIPLIHQGRGSWSLADIGRGAGYTISKL